MTVEVNKYEKILYFVLKTLYERNKLLQAPFPMFSTMSTAKHVKIYLCMEHILSKHTGTKKKRRVTYNDSFKGYDVVLHYILQNYLYSLPGVSFMSW